MSGGATSLVYGLSEAGTHASLTAPSVIWPTIAGLVLIGVFVLHALRIDRPLLDVRLYKNRIFSAASLTTFALGASLFGAMILVPLYYQDVRGFSVVETGLLQRPPGARRADHDADRRPPDGALRRRTRGARRSGAGQRWQRCRSCYIGLDLRVAWLSVRAVRPRGWASDCRSCRR